MYNSKNIAIIMMARIRYISNVFKTKCKLKCQDVFFGKLFHQSLFFSVFITEIYLTNIWRDNWLSVFDVVKGLRWCPRYWNPGFRRSCRLYKHSLGLDFGSHDICIGIFLVFWGKEKSERNKFSTSNFYHLKIKTYLIDHEGSKISLIWL